MAAGLYLAVYGAIAVLLVMLIVTLFPSDCSVAQRMEGFADTTTPSLESLGLDKTKCPPGSKSYVDTKGNLSCCSGTVNGHTCDGSVVCTYSDGLHSIPFCGTYSPKIEKVLQTIPLLKVEGPPERNENPTSEHVESAKPIFDSILATFKSIYYTLIVRDFTTDPKLELAKKGMDSMESWKTRFFDSASDTTIAKETLYQLRAFIKGAEPTSSEEEVNKGIAFVIALLQKPEYRQRVQNEADEWMNQAKAAGKL